ncbi:MAG: helix-turn-helix domain-containing protein [Bacteroidota bacterium]
MKIIHSIYHLKFVLLSLLFCLGVEGTAEAYAFVKELNTIPPEISSVKDENKKAVEWLLHLTEMSISDSPDLNQKLEQATSLWTNKYLHKTAIILLTEAEMDQTSGFNQATLEKITQAIDTLEKMPLSTVEEQKILCLSYIRYARISKYAGAEKTGLEYGYKALNIADSLQFPEGSMFAHNQIAQLIGHVENDMQLTLSHFQKARAQTDSIASSTLKNIYANVLDINIANAWSKLGQTEKAIATRLELIEKEGIKKNPQAFITLNNYLGKDYQNLGDYERAVPYLLRTMQLMNEHNSLKHYKGIPFLELGTIKIERSKIEEAAAYVDSIEHWLQTYPFVGAHKIKFLHLKSKIAKANNDLDQSIYWLEKTIEERDSLRKIVGPDKILALEEQSKFREVAQEKKLLEKELNSTKFTISAQKILLLIVGILLLFLVIYTSQHYSTQRSLSSRAEANKSIAEKRITSTTSRKKQLTRNLDHELLNAIEKTLKEDRLYLEQDLTLKKFADHLNTNTSYLSKTINEGFQKNFSALINEYRVEEVLRLFKTGRHRLYTIESIYQKAGFKSKSSFQKTFKAKTGKTASDFLSELEA